MTRMRRLGFGAAARTVAVVALMTLVLACSQPAAPAPTVPPISPTSPPAPVPQPTPAATVAPVTVTVKGAYAQASSVQGVLYVAREKRFFARHGLDVQLSQVG